MTDPTHAATSLGRARGRRADTGIVEFLGLRYAEPATGERRFGPPVPVSTWGSDPVDATEFASTPPQPEHDRLHLYPAMGEDCLSLNVWTPGADAAQRPVMVWIHGGGWFEESVSDPLYSGGPLAERGDIVVVSIEYRMNAFGFTHLAGVDGSGNAGILDQLEALRWVAEHIHAFGGDPSNVTIFGESAGGMSVSALVGLPAAEGLFSRAIMQSNVASTTRSPGFAAGITEATMNAASKLSGRPARTAEDLRALPWEQLLEATNTMAETCGLNPSVVFGPVVDGSLFPDAPMRNTGAGLNASVPILLGTNRDEFRYWIPLDPMLADRELPTELIIGTMAENAIPEGSTLEDTVALYRRERPDDCPLYVGFAGIDDVFFRMPVLRQAEQQVRSGLADSFLYEFHWEPSVPPFPDHDFGSPHAAELGFTLGTPDTYPEMYGDTWPGCLVDQMMDTWLAFARTGDPNHDGLPTWPAYDLGSRPTMIFDAAGDATTSRVENDPGTTRREFWQTVPFDGLTPSYTADDITG